MSAPLLQPSTVEELSEAVRSAPLVLARGADTKPNLSRADGAVTISTLGLTGIVDYAPSEFTFTARAGTTLREIIAVLGEQGQYLPFDPPLGIAGATLGGAVAAGLNGPGRLRFGGLRDFILGIRFVDGTGQALRLGGKVVKNAAGFDLPKFFVGSLGRFGILAEITFKVFPRPAASLTLEWDAPSDAEMVKLLGDAAKGRWELEALEVNLSAGKIHARLGAPAGALSPLAADLGRRWPAKILGDDEAGLLWQAANEFAWAHAAGPLCKLPLTLPQVPEFAALVRAIPDARGWVGAAGNVGHLSLPEGADIPGLDKRLRLLGFTALIWRGAGALWLGTRAEFLVQAAVKRALDSSNRFPALFPP